MKRPRRTIAELYPKLLTHAQATAYYKSLPPPRGHRSSGIRPLSTKARGFALWRITQTESGGIACMNGKDTVITYHVSGWVQLTPTTTPAYEVAVIRAVAPVTAAKWDYYREHLAVRANNTLYTCKVGESIWLPPLDSENDLHPLA